MDLQTVVQEYKRLRTASIDLSNALAKTLIAEDIRTAARQLGILHGKYIDFETEDESAVLMDHAIHDIFHDGLNAVGRLLLTEPYVEGSDELRLLRSMQQAHFAIINIEKPIPGVGVQAIDRLWDTPIFLIDMNFSHTVQPGAMLATRIHSPGEGWWMTTGAALPLNNKALDEIIDQIEDYESSTEDPARNAMILRTCVSASCSRQIRYANTSTAPTSSTLTVAPKVGRNEPCTCGSGKKYKKCCGR